MSDARQPADPVVFHADLAGLTSSSPDSIISRTLHTDDRARIILFTFAPGQELSEHTASVPATLYFVKGTADLTLGQEAHQAGPGTFAHMPANLPHSIAAKEEVIMLLTMYKGS